MQRRYRVASSSQLEELIDQPLPLGFKRGPLTTTRFRDIDLETPGGELAGANAACHLRILEEGTALLRFWRAEAAGTRPKGHVVESPLRVADLREALEQPSEALRQISSLVDARTLRPRLVLEIERVSQIIRRQRWFGPRLRLDFDTIHVTSGGLSHDFGEVTVSALRPGQPTFSEFASAFEHQHHLSVADSPRLHEARERVLEAKTGSTPAPVDTRDFTMIASHAGQIALRRTASGQLELPLYRCSGSEGPTEALDAWIETSSAEIKRLATLSRRADGRLLEVWLARVEEPQPSPNTAWYPIGDLLRRVGIPGLRDRSLIAALDALSRSPELGVIESRGEEEAVEAQGLATPPPATGPDRFLNGELSQLEFHARVLELARDPGIPLLERFRFLAIVTRNLDELFMVRVAALKHAVAEGENRPGADGLTATDQLELIAIRARQLMRSQYHCLRDELLPQLAEQGVRILEWEELTREQQHALQRYFDDQVFPLLTPRALTISPGHPFPHISNLDFSLAAILRDPRRPDAHFAHVRVPRSLPRFLPVPESGDLIPIERVIAAHYGSLYPQFRVEETYAFRVTRSGALELDEAEAVNLLDAVEREVQMRPFKGVLRVEVEEHMPRQVRELLLRELAEEHDRASASHRGNGRVSLLTRADLYEVQDLVDLRSLDAIADLERGELHYPPFSGRAALEAARPVFEQIAERDVLVHHPYESFESSVERFIVEAADDPDVVSIKLTHYRVGSQSNILSALLRAAHRGVDAAVFVELKARFDEEMNVEWAKKLDEGHVHVVHGLVGLKTHAKMALVVRREDERLVRYAHIGTGNYNAATARAYTDLGLLTANRSLTAEVHELFNELTGSASAPSSSYRELLVAPGEMLSGVLDRIEAEQAHAEAGRPARIRAKLNGLADRTVIEALYRASAAGVEIDLVVRGICLLRPGVPKLSENIRVVSLLGRFLEHARIMHFGNAGEDRYYIGSADLRSRNLRRRVEVLAPVHDPACQALLHDILERELLDPTAWDLQPDGRWLRRARTGESERPAVQDALVAALTASA